MQDKRLIRDITALLDKERDAILAGDYGPLPDLAARKEGLFAYLVKSRPGAAALKKIGAHVSRNQTLLQAAIAGIRDAGERMDVLRTTLGGFQAYAADGERQTVTSVRPNIERKF